jgi:hypothetical protein
LATIASDVCKCIRAGRNWHDGRGVLEAIAIAAEGIDEVDLHAGPRHDIGHGGEGVRMISGHIPESARVARANQKRTIPV